TSSRDRWCDPATTPTASATSSSPSARNRPRPTRTEPSGRMIPYFPSHLFDLPKWLGGVPIHWFGVLVALGVIVGDRIVVAQGRRRGLDANDVRYLNARIVIGGFIVAHLVSVIFYYPERIKESPVVLINVFAGLSSFGGFLGAFLAFMYFTK